MPEASLHVKQYQPHWHQNIHLESFLVPQHLLAWKCLHFHSSTALWKHYCRRIHKPCISTRQEQRKDGSCFITGKETSKCPRVGSNTHNRAGVSFWSQGMLNSLPEASVHLRGCSPGKFNAFWSGWNQSVTNMLALSYLQPARGHRSGIQGWKLQTVRFPVYMWLHFSLAG